LTVLGYFCVAGSLNATAQACPIGRYSTGGAQSLAQCILCPKGSHLDALCLPLSLDLTRCVNAQAVTAIQPRNRTRSALPFAKWCARAHHLNFTRSDSVVLCLVLLRRATLVALLALLGSFVTALARRVTKPAQACLSPSLLNRLLLLVARLFLRRQLLQSQCNLGAVRSRTLLRFRSASQGAVPESTFVHDVRLHGCLRC
jgi:hypothetical protein